MSFGTSIQIFLPDGNPRSIRLAEISNRTIQAISFPRAKIDEVKNRPEIKLCSVYFLIGSIHSDDKPELYIGEAEIALTRLKTHNQKKDFWTTAIAIVSKTQHLTKTHIKFLEWLCYTEALETNRYKLENTNIPTKPFVSEPMEAELRDNFETIKILVSTLGHPFFDKVPKPKKKDLIFCKSKDADAIGEYNEDGIIVFAGSKCKKRESNSAKSYVRNARKKLIGNKTLVEEGNFYIFKTNHIFSSPSSAAAVVLAREANGWNEWKYENGKTLDQIHRQESN